MVHNVGHLLGYEHSPDPSSVMNENIPAQARSGARFEDARRKTQRELRHASERFWSLDG